MDEYLKPEPSERFLTPKRKKILIIASVILVLFLGFKIYINSGFNRDAKLKLGTKLYEQAYAIYTTGDGIKIKQDKKGNLSYIEKDYTTSLKKKITLRYYEIANYSDLKKIFTSGALKQMKKDLGIIEKDGKYYFKETNIIDRTYLKTDLKIKSIHLLKVEFIAVSSYCEDGYQVGYGTGCLYYNKITKKETPFTIKFTGKWKISEFTKSN